MLAETVQRKIATFRALSWQERIHRAVGHVRTRLWHPLTIAAFLPVGLPALALCKALRPVVRIRVLSYYASRIGHQVGDFEVYLRRKGLAGQPPHRELDILLTESPANRQLLRMTRRMAWIINSAWALRGFRWLQGALPGNGVIGEVPAEHNLDFTIVNKTKNQIKFTDGERKRGEALLAEMGVAPGAPYICFHARDQRYLKATTSGRDFSYHDFRDATIENYLLATEALAATGIWSLRMGAVVQKPIVGPSPRVIDYATAHRTDFGDIYLPAHCKFFVGSPTGMTNIATFFEVPLVWVNVVPMDEACWRTGDLFIVRRHVDIKTGRTLKFSEVIALGADRWFQTSQFVAAGIKALENTPEEIRDVALEMNDRLDGRWVDEKGDDELQAAYQRLWLKGVHRNYQYPSRLGAAFLRQNRHLLDL